MSRAKVSVDHAPKSIYLLRDDSGENPGQLIKSEWWTWTEARAHPGIRGWVKYTLSTLPKPDAERKLEEAVVKAAMDGWSLPQTEGGLKQMIFRADHIADFPAQVPFVKACARLELHRRKNRRAGR